MAALRDAARPKITTQGEHVAPVVSIVQMAPRKDSS